MASGPIIVICQSGGSFTTASDGSLTYSGGDAHAITVDRQSKFDDIKAELAEMWKYESHSFTAKYFLPNNKRTLITISCDKDVQRMIDFHGNSATVDLYVLTNENATNEDSPVPCSRSSRTTEEEPPTPINVVPYTPDDGEQLDLLTTVATEVGDYEQPKRVRLWEKCITGLHQQFSNVHELRDALRKYSIAHGFTIRFKKNDCSRVTAKCKVQSCSWRIHASRLSTTPLFRIKRMNSIHTCGAGINTPSRAQASKKVVAGIVMEKLRNTPNVKPKEIANQIRQEFGIELRYSQARRWMEAASADLLGSYKEAFNQLPWFCEKIVETNPGSTVRLITRENKSFHGLFAAFHASIHGFVNGCRPLLFLDTTTLNSKYQSELLTATGVDGDCGIFPVAYAVVDVVNDDNWHWFLAQLKSALSSSLHPITFVADKELGLKQSISVVFENSYHAYCLRYLADDLKRTINGPCTHAVLGVLVAHLYDAAYAPTLDEFRNCIENIKSISPEAADWIMQSEPEHWANAIFGGSRYNHVTSSIAESFFSQITELSVLPAQIIDTIRHKTMELIYTRKVDSEKWLTRLTPSVEDKLQKEIQKAQSIHVFSSNGSIYEVRHNTGAINHVNIDVCDCSCREWKLNGYPCYHAVAALQCAGRDLYDYCSRCFTTEAFHVTYSETIKPVPTVDKPEGPLPIQVLPPPLRDQSTEPGHPRRIRNRSKGEIKRPLHCSRCKGEGHNRKSCRASLMS